MFTKTIRLLILMVCTIVVSAGLMFLLLEGAKAYGT